MLNNAANGGDGRNPENELKNGNYASGERRFALASAGSIAESQLQYKVLDSETDETINR